MYSAATVKLGENQFEKLSKSDRNNLLGAMYETLSKPSIVLEKETLDEKSGEFRPVHVYGKSFVREDSNHKKAIESVIIFKDGENIAIGTHNKELGRFSRQIKTADQIIFADPEISRVTSLVLQNGGSHVQLKGINPQALNKQYDKNKLLSIKDFLQFSNADEMLPHFSQSEYFLRYAFKPVFRRFFILHRCSLARVAQISVHDFLFAAFIIQYIGNRFVIGIKAYLRGSAEIILDFLCDRLSVRSVYIQHALRCVIEAHVARVFVAVKPHGTD